MTNSSETKPDCQIYLVNCGYAGQVVERIQALTGLVPQVADYDAGVLRERCAAGHPTLVVYGSFEDTVCRALGGGGKISDLPAAWAEKATELEKLAIDSNGKLRLVQDRALFGDADRVLAVIDPFFSAATLNHSAPMVEMRQPDKAHQAFARLITAAIPELQQVQEALCQHGVCLPVTKKLAGPIDLVAVALKDRGAQSSAEAAELKEEIAQFTVLREAEREADATSRALRLNLYLADLREKQAYIDDLMIERWRVEAALRQLKDTKSALVAQRKTSDVLRARLLEFENAPTTHQHETVRDA